MEKKRYRIMSSKLFLLAVVVAIVFVSIEIAQEMYKAYQIEEEVKEMDEQIETLKKERLSLNEDLAYLQTDSFKQLEYRRRTNKIRPDEEVWVLNNLDNLEDEPLAEEGEVLLEDEDEEKDQYEATKDNWRLWWELFFGG